MSDIKLTYMPGQSNISSFRNSSELASEPFISEQQRVLTVFFWGCLQVIIQGFRSYRDQTVVDPFSPKHNVIGKCLLSLTFLLMLLFVYDCSGSYLKF